MNAGSPAELVRSLDWAAIGFMAAAVALGFLFGVESTGRLATVWMQQQTMLAPETVAAAAWVEQAKRLRWGAVVVFGVGAVGGVVAYERGGE